MGRINSNIPAVAAGFQLGRSQKGLGVSLQRLSSGLKINRGADNPAGLIVSERLRSEISAVSQAIDNSERAINVISTTEASLNEISALLTDIQGLVVEAANAGAFSPAETDANQLQIDSAIDSITRIANTATFAGRKLLDGSLGYFTSGVDTASLANVLVQEGNFGTRSSIPVVIDVSQSGLQAELAFQASATGNATVSVDLQGPDGIITLSFPANTETNDIVQQINTVAESTGVTASANGYTTAGDPTTASGVVLRSAQYGSEAFVSVSLLNNSGAFDLVDRAGSAVSPGGTRVEGRNAVATINGAATVGRGLKLALKSFLLDVEVTLDSTFGTGNSEFAITGGGSLYQLGPRVNINQQETIGIQSMQANKLGSRLVGFLADLQSGASKALASGNFSQASDVVDEVVTQVSVLRGRLGAFERNKLQPNINQLQVLVENLTSSESVIRDTDFAEETTDLTRSQILVQAGTSILAIANAQQQNVLSLLGG